MSMKIRFVMSSSNKLALQSTSVSCFVILNYLLRQRIYFITLFTSRFILGLKLFKNVQ